MTDDVFSVIFLKYKVALIGMLFLCACWFIFINARSIVVVFYVFLLVFFDFFNKK
jgi:hypothetical protein